MTAAATVIHPALPASPCSRRWLLAVTACFSAFYASYATGFVGFANFMGIFPVRPILWMLLSGIACLALILPAGPVFSRTSLAIMLLLAAKIADTATQRWPHGEPWLERVFSIGSMLFLVIVTAAAIGVFMRTTTLPLITAAAVCVIAITVANYAEAAGMYKFSTVEGRSAGFHGDANDAGIGIVANLAVILVCSRRYWFNASMIAVAAAGIVPTYSRSGFILLALVILTFLAQNLRSNGRRVLLTCGAGVLAAIAAAALAGLRSGPAGGAKDSNVQDRTSAIFGGDVQKMGSSERMKDLSDGWNAVTLQPLSGYGTGAGTGHWQPHNQIVSIWLDLGIAGVLFYAAILLSLLVKSLAARGTALLCVLPVIGFVPFSQMLLDHPSVWCAAITAALVTCRRPLRFALFHPAQSGPDLQQQPLRA